MKRIVAAVLVPISVLFLAALSGSGLTASTRPGDGPSEARPALVETFVLTPIHMETADLEVPAGLVGPMTNKACGDWEGHQVHCYLPARVLTPPAAGSWPELTLRYLLERHASSALGAWKVGAWPAGGASLVIDLARGASLEHLWLTTRVGLREQVGYCWLTAEGDPRRLLDRAVAEPQVSFAVEVFDGTHDAPGFPKTDGPP